LTDSLNFSDFAERARKPWLSRAFFRALLRRPSLFYPKKKGKKVETGRKNLCKLKRVAKIFTPVEKRCGKTCGDCGKV